CVTQPGGASTYTFYDALGRVIGVASPRRNTTGALDSVGVPFDNEVTPYTAMFRDAFGNVVEQLVTSVGDLSSSTPTSPPPAVQPTDAGRKTVYARDALGRIVQTQDPDFVERYASYTATGQIAKEWQYVQFYGASSYDALVTIHQYDALDRETDVI